QPLVPRLRYQTDDPLCDAEGSQGRPHHARHLVCGVTERGRATALEDGFPGEGVSGSIEKFADEMNDAAHELGMTQTSYVNPNGLPAEGQITSARDLAILARAIIRDLPEYEYFYHIPPIRFGRKVTQNFNKLIGRYPGADGFKTGFICASGYNLVASARRNGKWLVAVGLGAD